MSLLEMLGLKSKPKGHMQLKVIRKTGEIEYINVDLHGLTWWQKIVKKIKG